MGGGPGGDAMCQHIGFIIYRGSLRKEELQTTFCFPLWRDKRKILPFPRLALFHSHIFIAVFRTEGWTTSACIVLTACCQGGDAGGGDVLTHS